MSSVMLCRLYFITGFCSVLLLNMKVLQRNRGLTQFENIDNLPMKSDLMKYLDALNRVIEFSSSNENNVDINFYFGLFLANVNLKSAMGEKHEFLPERVRLYVEEIIHKTEHLLDFFKYAIQRNHDPSVNRYKTIFSLFSNQTNWTNRLPSFHSMCLQEEVAILNLEKVNVKWNVYKKNIDDRYAWIPNPHQSDLCLTSLASVDETDIETSRRCIVLKFCYDMLKNGTDFGYALAHRLLFLQQAAYGRGCIIFSAREDQELRQRFCSTVYREAKYIAAHDFEIIDLLLEHVCLCALEGNGIFLKRSWLTNILNFQTVNGCFSPYITNGSKTYMPRWSKLAGWKGAQFSEFMATDGYCNGHTTALAAGTLAIASRYIIQFYY